MANCLFEIELDHEDEWGIFFKIKERKLTVPSSIVKKCGETLEEEVPLYRLNYKRYEDLKSKYRDLEFSTGIFISLKSQRRIGFEGTFRLKIKDTIRRKIESVTITTDKSKLQGDE